MENMSSSDHSISIRREDLERLYNAYHSRRWVHPDPLEFLYDYPNKEDREIVGLIAASLAYGRVAQILVSVSRVLKKLGPSPAAFITCSETAKLKKTFSGFKHRFTTSEELVQFLRGIGEVCRRYGSLEKCFLERYDARQDTTHSALCFLVENLKGNDVEKPNSLLPVPQKGSACKRLHLFLRWMVRKDDVDPGDWQDISPAKLIVPLDVHMHRTCSRLKFTCRKQGNLKTAVEITHAFRKVSPDDPVKYDFALTRLGIRKDCDPENFFQKIF